MTHTPALTAGVYRCPACSFHAIATQDGLHVLDSGIGRQLHLAAIAQQQIELRAYVEALLRRLVQVYNERRALPERDDNCDDLVSAGVWDARYLTMRTVRELSKHIRAEYGL